MGPPLGNGGRHSTAEDGRSEATAKGNAEPAMTTSMVVLDCGRVDHDPTCLCDVELGLLHARFGPEGVPIKHGFCGEGDWEPSLWLARAMRLGVPWKHGDILSFVDALTAGYEAYREQTAQDTAYVQNVDDVPDDGRREIAALLRAGHSMIDVPQLLGQTYEELCDTLSYCNQRAFYRSWGDIEWLKLEALIEGSDVLVISDLYKALGLNKRTAVSLGKIVLLYGKRLRSGCKPLDQVSEFIRPLIEGGETNLNVLIAACRDAGLEPPSRDALAKRVKRVLNPPAPRDIRPRFAANATAAAGVVAVAATMTALAVDAWASVPTAL